MGLYITKCSRDSMRKIFPTASCQPESYSVLHSGKEVHYIWVPPLVLGGWGFYYLQEPYSIQCTIYISSIISIKRQQIWNGEIEVNREEGKEQNWWKLKTKINKEKLYNLPVEIVEGKNWILQGGGVQRGWPSRLHN